MHTRYIKFIIWVIALVAAWNLGQSSAFSDALFEFAAAGAVPGTNITLGPNQVLALLTGVLILAVLLIFSANIRRGLRRLVTRVPVQDGLGEQMAVRSVPAAQAATTKHRKRKAEQPRPVIIIEPPKRPSRTLLLLHVAGSMLAMGARAQAAKVHKYYPRAAAVVLRQWRRAMRIARRIGLRTRAVLIRAAIVVCRAAIRAWRWAEPYLRRFDAWLGAHYHQAVAALTRSESFKLAHHFGREAAKVIASARSELRAVLSRVSEK